ncbi:MAG: Crp/Fnr family transcriptional regulator [Terriglobales bacterium]
MSVQSFPKGANLFQRGSEVTGLYVLEHGEVHVLLPKQRHQHLLKVVGPGAILGLSENLTGQNYRITAEASVETTAAYIPREEFLKFLRSHGEFSMEVLLLLSEDLHGLYDKYANVSARSGRRSKVPALDSSSR